MQQYQEGVDQPQHYTKDGLQPIDVIEAWGLGFHLGTAVKYIGRAGKKPGESRLKDLEKAHWYLSRVVEMERQNELKMVVDIRAEQQERVRAVEGKMDIPDPYKDCSWCGGSGIVHQGEPDEKGCIKCNGTGQVLKQVSNVE